MRATQPHLKERCVIPFPIDSVLYGLFLRLSQRLGKGQGAKPEEISVAKHGRRA
jgi:hypothetical protein